MEDKNTFWIILTVISILGICAILYAVSIEEANIDSVCKQIGFDYGNSGTFFNTQACYNIDCTVVNGVHVCKKYMHRFERIDGNTIYGIR